MTLSMLTGPQARKFHVALLGGVVLVVLRWLNVDYAELSVFLIAAGVWKAENKPEPDDEGRGDLVTILAVIALVLAILWLVGVEVRVG